MTMFVGSVESSAAFAVGQMIDADVAPATTDVEKAPGFNVDA